MSGTSGLDFKSVGSEIAYWLAHTTSTFKGGHPGSGENGNDFGMPEGTPVYAILPGKVVGVGNYGGGGVVSVQYNSKNIIYYQHLRANQAKVGDNVAVGQQIGLSGGLHMTDGRPVTCCSSYSHIEVGVNAPFGSFWNPSNLGPNIDPRPLFAALNLLYSKQNVGTGTSKSFGSNSLGSFTGLVGGTSSLTGGTSNLVNPLVATKGGSNNNNSSSSSTSTCNHPINILGQQVVCVPDWLYNLVTQPQRMFKFGVGMFFLTVATALLVIPLIGDITGRAMQAAGTVTGQPEVSAAGAFLQNPKKVPRLSRGRQAASAYQTGSIVRRQREDSQKRTEEIKMRAAPTTRGLGEETEPVGTPKSGIGFEQERKAQQPVDTGDLRRRADEAYAKSLDPTRSPGERRFWRQSVLDYERRVRGAGGTPKEYPNVKPVRTVPTTTPKPGRVVPVTTPKPAPTSTPTPAQGKTGVIPEPGATPAPAKKSRLEQIPIIGKQIAKRDRRRNISQFRRSFGGAMNAPVTPGDVGASKAKPGSKNSPEDIARLAAGRKKLQEEIAQLQKEMGG